MNGSGGTAGGGSFSAGAPFVDDDLLKNEKLFPRDLEPCLSLALALLDTFTPALCDADLFTRLNTAFMGLDDASGCRALFPFFSKV